MPGCRRLYQADKTIYGSPKDDRPAMHRRAPAAITVITELRGPESVLHDAEQDVYFISNLNGGLLTADNNGFITRVDAKSFAVNLKWIEGGRDGVRLDAPKGMAIIGDTLYVSDIGCVRRFNRRSGASMGEIAMPGTTLVNDIATDGRILYVSDTGIKPGPGPTFNETGTDAIWKITNDRPEKLASGDNLDHPNGVDVAGGTVRVVAFKGNAIYAIKNGKREDIGFAPASQLDGLAHIDNDTMLVTSWEGDAIYRGSPKNGFEPVLAGIDAPADIGYDAKRHRLLVPSSGTNQVTIHEVH